MADRHQRGVEAAIDRLEEVNEELENHRNLKVVIREIKRVEQKIVKLKKARL